MDTSEGRLNSRSSAELYKQTIEENYTHQKGILPPPCKSQENLSPTQRNFLWISVYQPVLKPIVIETQLVWLTNSYLGKLLQTMQLKNNLPSLRHHVSPTQHLLALFSSSLLQASRHCSHNGTQTFSCHYFNF